MLRLHHFLFGNRRLLFVLRLFRGFLRRRVRRLLRERATCTKEKRCGETQKTMRTLHGRQLSLSARNDNWRRAASYARARASSIGSERCSRCVRPAILIATRKITVRMRPTKEANFQERRNAPCWPVRRYSSLPRWPWRPPGARRNKRKKIFRIRRPLRNCKRQ